MQDCHIHIERGDYTFAWIGRFVDTALSRGMDEIWLLEHCYRFREFVPMYDDVCVRSPYIDAWFHRKAGVLSLADYLRLIDEVRAADFPLRIRFGLEVCYFHEQEDFVRHQTQGMGLDFLVGSVHFIDGFAFDHFVQLWDGVDVDHKYRRYFEMSIALAESGLFDGIAHPDSIKLFGHKASFSLLEAYDRLAGALAAQGMYAEQSSGIKRRTGAALGMDPELLAVMKRYGVTIRTASDAHYPEEVGLGVRQLYKMLG